MSLSLYFCALVLFGVSNALWGKTTTTTTTTTEATCSYSWSDIELKPSIVEWMHLAYIIADNDLDRNSAETLNQMRLNEATTDELNLLVYIDRSSDIDEQQPITNISDCTDNNKPISGVFTGSKLLQKHGNAWCQIYDFNDCELDSMQSDNIAGFMALMAPYQQAATYFVLTFWDHGGAWMGFGQDMDTGGNSSTTDTRVYNLDTLFSAIRRGLHSTPYIGRLDILGFDACIMADYSVLHYASAMDVAKYLIVSEVPEPADNSWNYTALDASGATCALDYAVAIVDAYVDQGSVNALNGGYTLAVFDMDKVAVFLAEFNTLMRIATFALDSGDYGMLMAILRGERESVAVTDESDAYHIYDLGLFLSSFIENNIFWDTCNDRVHSVGDNAWFAFDDCIVYFRADFIREDLQMTGATIFFSTNPHDIARFDTYNDDFTSSYYVAFLRAMNQTLESIASAGGDSSFLTKTVCSAAPPHDLSRFTLSNASRKDTYYTDIGLYTLELDVSPTVMRVNVFAYYTYVPVATLEANIVDVSLDATKVVVYWDGRISNFVNTAEEADSKGLALYSYSTAEITYDGDVHYSIRYPLYVFDTSNVTHAMQLYAAGQAKSGYIEYDVSLVDLEANATVAADDLLLYEIEGGSGVISAIDTSQTRIIVGVVSGGSGTNQTKEATGAIRWPEIELRFESIEEVSFRIDAVDVFGTVSTVQIDDISNATRDIFLTTTTTTNAPISTESSTTTTASSSSSSTKEESSTTTTTTATSTASSSSSSTAHTTDEEQHKSKSENEKGLNSVDGVVWLVIIIVLLILIVVLCVAYIKTKKQLSAAGVIDASGTGYVQMGGN
eukprot:446135_1